MRTVDTRFCVAIMMRMGGRIWTKLVRARWWVLSAVAVVAVVVVYSGADADRTVYTFFDGTTCDYRGPRLLAADSTIAFRFVNGTDGGAAGYRVWKVTGDADPSFSTRRSVDRNDVSSVNERDIRAISPPSRTASVTHVVKLDSAGMWAIDCFEGGAVPDASRLTVEEYPSNYFRVR